MISGGLYYADDGADPAPSAGPSAAGKAPAPVGGKPRVNLPKNVILPVAAIIIIVVIAAAALVLYRPSSTTTSTSTTTVANSHTTTINLTVYQINSCATIKEPGIYNLVGNITTANTTAPCISILSGEVILHGNGHGVEGNGPFVQSLSPSYGIYVASVSGVTVENITVSKFSYGVYFSGVSNSSVIGVRALNATMSSIYLNDSYNNILSNDTVYSSESNKGGLYISMGGNNTIRNSSIKYNAYYGLYINSSGNRFYGDTFFNNPVDLECGANAYERNTNLFKGSSCQVNQYCNFAVCKNQNVPYNVNSSVLQTSVSSCGAINNMGTYKLTGNISLASYVNTSNPLSSKSACITINSPDVKLDCANNTISNAYYGVDVGGLYNTSVVDCSFKNDTYGLYEGGTIGTVINNIKAYDNVYGVYLNSTTGSLVSNMTGYNNVFGLYLNTSSGTNVYGIKTSNNSYGVYVNGQQGNQYYSGASENNTKGDVYCSASAYNSTQNIFQALGCGSTDCGWANSCKTTLSAPLLVTPVYSCSTISSSGSYVLKKGVLSKTQGTCMNILANNVTFNCDNNELQGSGGGSALYIQNRTGVTVENCNVNNFGSAFNISKSEYITIINANISRVDYGVHASNVSYSMVKGVNVSVFAKEGFLFSMLNNTVVQNNNAREGALGAVSFSFSGAFADLILNNNAQNNGGYGFSINSSKGNKMINNTETGNGKAGYYCDPYSSGLYAQPTNVNYGVGKVGCNWMIEVNPEVTQSCSAILSSSTVALSQDMLYTYGSTCFSVINQNGKSANNTVINCEGHTVFATKGGTFVNISGSSGTQIENCYMKNFTQGVVSNGGSDTVVLNNTFANLKTAVNMKNADYNNVRGNRITNSSYGVYLQNARYGSVENNTFTNTNISMEFSGLFSEVVSGNKVGLGNIGVYLLNSTEDILSNNILLNQSNSGIICNGGSENISTLNKDYGNNVCSGNIACKWMTASPLCKVG